MAENSEFVLHYITNSLLSAQTANSVAKIEMARSFCKQDRIKKVFFYMLVENKEKLQALNLGNISDKLIVKPLFFSRNVEQALHGKDFWPARYKTFFVNPTCYLRAFLLALKLAKTDVVFIRGHESLVGFYLGSVLTGARYAFELHNYFFGKNRFTDLLYRRFMKRAQFVVTVSEYTKDGWVDNAIAKEKIVVLSSGVNLEDFDRINKKPAQLRKELDLPADKKIITYSGGLYENRGIEDILYCASKYENYLFLFIGGIEKQIQKYESYIHSQLRTELPNVIFTGHLKHEKIALYLKASDILVAPYSKKVETARHFSSIKLAEYAASKIPVIASDLPSITKTFAEDELTFFRPGDADDLCEKIKLVFNNYEQAEAKAEKACEKVRDFSWDKRAGKIADLFQS